MEQSKTKKRGTFAAKIIVMVILAVIVSNVICMVFILEKLQKTNYRQHKAYHGRCYQYNIKNCGE